MSEDHRLGKVSILIQQQKYTEAESILKDMLSADPNDTGLLSLFAEVHLQQDKLDSALSIIQNAIGLSPNDPDLFYIQARIVMAQGKLAEAENIAQQALKLDPNDADTNALLAHIKLHRKQFAAALDWANRALEIDAENLLGLNTRSAALNKLNRSDESSETIEGALREDPNNPYTHANYGWVLLEQGKHKKALGHFKESLKNDPNFEYAQAGMLEAIKATNPIYRLFLRYSFWMSNMSGKSQWGVIIAFVIGFRVLRSLARSNDTLKPFLIPLIILLAVVAFSTWIIPPIGNLFLRFNKYGQLLLDKKDKMSANLVAISLVTSLMGWGLYLATSGTEFLTLAVFGLAMMLPLGVMFSPSKGKNSLVIYTIAMAVVGLMAVVITILTGELINTASLIFIVGIVAFQWIANYLLIKEDNG